MSDDRESISTPSQFLEHEVQFHGMERNNVRVSPNLVMVYSIRALKFLQRLARSKVVEWWWWRERPLHTGRYKSTPVALICNWIGAPAACMILEEVIALGAKEIIEVGYAGGIQPYLKLGDIFIVTNAKRDEGTSLHYFPPNVKVECCSELCQKIEGYFNKQRKKYYKGAVWTTDGIFRETKGKFRRFKREQVLGVNMETSALLTVAKYRKVKLASIQIVTDILSEASWLLAFRSREVQNSTRIALKAALEALSTPDSY